MSNPDEHRERRTGVSGPPRRASGPRGFTLIEMLTTVAALVIMLGLMVSLAKYVRGRSAETLTRQLLAKLETLMSAYSEDKALAQRLKSVPPLVAGDGKPDDMTLRRRAEENIAQFVRVLHAASPQDVLRNLPAALYDQTLIRDAWGTPVAYLAPGAANIGIGVSGRAFFVSAGPDRRFTTTADNLYSYEK